MGVKRLSVLLFLWVPLASAQIPGVLDATFMPPGEGFVSSGTNYMGVVALPGGKLLVHGQATGNFRGIARLQPDGAMDSSFVVGTGAEDRAGIQLAYVSGVEVQSDGRLLLCGNFTSFNGTAATGLIRLQPDGAIDSSFRPGSNIQPGLIRLLADGRLVVRNWDNQLYLLQDDGSLSGANPLFDGALFMPKPLAGDSTGALLMEHNLIFFSEVMAEGKLVRVFTDWNNRQEVVWRGTVIEAAPLENGRFLVRGSFTNINGTGVSNLAVLQPDLSVDPAFKPGVNGLVTDAKPGADGSIHFVGAFTAVNGVARRGVARVLPTGALDMGFAPAGFDGTEAFGRTGVAVQGNNTVVSGTFNQYQGEPRSGLLRLSQNGALDPGFPSRFSSTGPNDAVNAIARSAAGGYFLGGGFITVSGISARGLVRTTEDGLVDTSFNIGSGFNGPVFALLALTNGGVLAGGHFTLFNGHPCGSIVRLNADGTKDTKFNADPGIQGQNATVAALALLPDERVVVGGQFSTYNGTARDGIARLMANGALDGSFNPGTGISSPTNRIILGITLVPGGQMLINGRFLSYNGANRGHAARINDDGTLDSSFTGGTGDMIRCLQVMPDGRIVVGGAFTRSIGVDQNRVARWYPDGALDTSFNAGKNLDGTVRGMALQADGRVIVGGQFHNYGPIARPGIARLNDDGTLDTSFDPGIGLAASSYIPTIEAMTVQDDNTVLIAGAFDSYAGQQRSHVARVFTAVLPSTQPNLETRMLPGGQLEIRWPEAAGFALESTSGSGLSLWESVPDVPPAQNGQRSYVLSPAGSAKFYRLKK